MRLEGVDGHVTAKGHEKWIELDAINFNVNRNISTKPGNVADRETTKPCLSEFTATKIMDKTSPHIFIEACIGKAKPKVEIHFCQTGETISSYMEYTLYNVLFSHYSIQADNKDDRTIPMERISLNFDKVEMKYTPYDEKHGAQSPVPAGYDLNTAQKI